MWSMAQSSIVLFFQGKLFADPAMVARQLAIGGLATALILVLATKLGAPLWAAAGLAGLAGGLLQPYLFKDLKYQ